MPLNKKTRFRNLLNKWGAGALAKAVVHDVVKVDLSWQVRSLVWFLKRKLLKKS